MKKVLALVLTLVLVLGLGASSAFADGGIKDTSGTTSWQNVSVWSLATNTEDDLKAYDDFSWLYLGDSTVQKQFGLMRKTDGVTSGLDGWATPIRAVYKDTAGNVLVDPADGLEGYAYGWRGDYRESTSVEIKYTTETGGRASGSPKGVNGEELLHTRIAFNSNYIKVGSNAADALSGYVADPLNKNKVYSYNLSNYIIYMTPIANPTVEVFKDVQVKVRLVRADGAAIARYDAIVWSGFSLANKRYTDKHVYADANGIYRIDATSNWPVLDVTALQKSYGKKLVVDYPTYRVIFPTVKKQDTSLNLQAAVTKQATVDLDDDKALMTATFHDIYVKDTVQIEFKVGFDVQNYKGVKLYAYAFNADGTINTSKELAVTITEHGTVVIEVPAGTKLSANGDANNKLGTVGLFATPQKEGTPVDVPNTSTPTTTTPSTKNPGTGANDVVNVATAFAVISLAAAAFVSVKKASK